MEEDFVYIVVFGGGGGFQWTPCSERSKSMKKLDRLTITSNEQSKLIDPPTVLIGNTVRDSPPPQEQTEGIRIDGDSGSFWLTNEILSRGLLNIGSTGSGKTNLIYSISSAILGHLKDNEIVVFFDYKGDYFNAFFDKHNPNHIVISTQDKHKPYRRRTNISRTVVHGICSESCLDGKQ